YPGLCPDGGDSDDPQQLMPAGSLRKKKLARRPGYMRPEVQRQIEFQSVGACPRFSPAELQHGRQHCGGSENCSLCRQCQNNLEFLCCGAVSSAVVPANGVTTLATTGNTPGCCGNLSYWNNPWSESTVIGVYPAASTGKGDASAGVCTRQKSHSTKVSKPPNMYALDQTEVNNNCEYQNRGGISHYAGVHDSFRSSFSFIQLSLNSASGVNDIEGKSVEEAEIILHPKSIGNLQKPEVMAQTHEHLGNLCCFPRSGEDLRHEHESPVNDKLQDFETLSVSDIDATFSYSTDSSDAASAGSSVTSGYESSFTVSDHNWDTLMKKYEPVLQDCLLGNRSTLKLKSLIFRLQRLQEKAIEEDDYDRADKFRRKLEELEKEKNSLKFQLPSRHPSVSSFLDRFMTQIQATLRWAADDCLQEKEQLFSTSIKETTAKVCTSQKLCSTLRRKVSDIETQLPALLEAKMLAVSGNNFGTAKDLAEEIRSLTSEKEGLEGLLNELLVLSARNTRKLERIKDDYTRLKQELELGETAFVASVKENAEKYMEILEDKLHSCGSQLLQRVWEADLEACQLLIRGFQLKETSCCVFEEEENQMDEMEMTADAPPDSEKRKEGHFLKGTEWNAVSCPKHRELKEEFFIFSAELGEKCEAISEKLVHLEDQLQSSACRVDEGVIHILFREIQVVKETLQTVLVQLQSAKEAGEEKDGDFLCDSWCPGKQDLKE
uniref:DISC1 scaffold protein n=1 Tax=Malurus cyaneus samueli TaxID=2593467 RepID=A0A8C5UJS1_9PASS